MSRGCFICHCCGARVTCGTDELPCELLTGWLMVSRWGGPGAIEHYSFCCFTCLKAWMDSQVPDVPDVFLKAFDN